jgi:cytochrome P450
MHLSETWQSRAYNHCFADRPDFIHKLFELRKKGKVTDVDIFNIINTNVAAGSDTTGATLAAAFYHVTRTPHVIKTLREEMDRLSAEGKCSNPVTFAEAQQMPYLQAIIKETLRIHPATGLLHGRVVPAEVSRIGNKPHNFKTCSLCIYLKQYDVLH